MTDCPTQADFDRYHAGEMDEAEAAGVQAHLDGCSKCAVRDASLVAAHEDLLARLRGLTKESPAQVAPPSNRTQTAPDSSEKPRSRPHVTITGYDVIVELSHGGQGIVYRAKQKSTNREVAIKVLLEGAYASDAARKRFQREIELAAQLKHPNIITIFDSGTTEDGLQYCVMDYVEGLPLHKFARAKELGLEDTLRLFSTVCDAIEHAHDRGVIHRDLKPSNILVNKEGRPRILDFGLAKTLEATAGPVVSFSQDVVGTLPYMSPEQAQGKRDAVDTRTDVYALGIMLYELLTGKFPYPVDGQMSDVLRHIIETPPAPPRRQWKSASGVKSKSSVRFRSGACPIDRDAQTILFKTLEKEPVRRYASAAALSEDVSRYLQHEPILARPPSVVYRLKKFARKRWLPLLATAAVLIAAGVAASFRFEARSAVQAAARATVGRLVFEAKLESHRNIAKAIRLYEDAMALAPKNVEIEIARVYLLRRANRRDDAIAAASAIIDEHPDKAGPAHLLLAQLFRDRDPGLAAMHTSKGAQLLPDDKYYRALALGDEQPEEAIRLLSTVIENDPLNNEALLERAWLYHHTQDWQGMLKDAELLTVKWPDTALYWNAKAIALARLKKLPQAIASYDRAIQLAPKTATILLNRANVYLETGNENLAIADCNHAVSLDPELAAAYALRAKARAEQRNTVSAEQDCQKALALAPENTLALRTMGSIHLSHGEFRQALDAYNRGMEGGQGWAGDFHNRARIYRHFGNFHLALKDHNRAVALAPTSELTLVGRAVTKRCAGDIEGALADFQAAAHHGSTWTIQSHLWTWEMLTFRGMPGDVNLAAQALEAADKGAETALEKTLLGICRGYKDAEEALESASSATERCMVLYYSGVYALTKRDQANANKRLTQCRDTAAHRTVEYDLALFHLRRLARSLVRDK